jgi:hypothetical protein
LFTSFLGDGPHGAMLELRLGATLAKSLQPKKTLGPLGPQNALAQNGASRARAKTGKLCFPIERRLSQFAQKELIALHSVR